MEWSRKTPGEPESLALDVPGSGLLESGASSFLESGASSFLEALWLLMVLVTPLFVNFWVEQQFEASKLWLLRSLIWLSALVWLADWTNGGPSRPLTPTLRRALVGLGLVLLLSTLLSTDPYTALFGSLDRANGALTQLSYLLLFTTVATRISGPTSRKLLDVAILTGVPICLLALAQAAGWQPLPVLSDARSPLTTTLGRANFTGAYLALLLPLTLVAVQSAQTRWQRGGYVVFLLLQIAVIALTQARAAWIAGAVGLAVLLWLQAAPRWSRPVRWLSGLGGLIAGAGVLVFILQWGIASGGSIAARWTIWQASLRLLWPRLWLGYGGDTLDQHFPAVYPPQLVYYQGRGVVVDRAHNWLLDWSLSYGVVATILLIGLISLVFHRGWRHLVTDDQNHKNCWLAPSLAAICAQLVGNLFLFEVGATGLLFWLLLAIVAAATTRSEPPPISFSLPAWGRTLGAGAGIVLLVWAVWQSNLRPLLADAHSWRGTLAVSQGNLQSALAEYTAAVDWQPQRSEYRVALALTAAQVDEFPLAEAALYRAIALRPTDPVLYTQLATIYAQESAESPERLPLAYAAYEQAIALAPTIGLTFRQYADLALRSGEWVKSMELAQAAVDLDATDATAFGIWGWASLQQGNPTAAQAAFVQAVKWQPDSADYHLGLALAFFQQDNFEGAQEALQHSLRLDPNYEPGLTEQLQRELRAQ